MARICRWPPWLRQADVAGWLSLALVPLPSSALQIRVGFRSRGHGGSTMGENDRGWTAVRDAAVSVVFLSQRPAGMWSLPTSDFDLRQPGATAGSQELSIRKREKFGHASITVSWIALRALRAALDRIPPQARSVLDEVSQFRSPRHSYGSIASRLGGKPSINDSPRHTATALLLLMEFGSDHHQLADLLPNIRWLISQALPGGGWRFEANEDRMGPITTATSLAALSRFAASAPGQLIGSDLDRNLNSVIGAGYAALVASVSNGVWDGSAEGRFQSTEVGDAAFIIWLLGRVLQERPGSLQATAIDEIRSLRRDLLAAQVDNGWPRSISSTTPSVPTTIWVLRMAADALDDGPSYHPKEATDRAARYVIHELERPETWRGFEMWDWAMLTELASIHVGGMDERTENTLWWTLDGIAETHRKGLLTRNDIQTLPLNARDAVEYCLSQGDRLGLTKGPIERWWKNCPEWQRSLGALLAGATLGQILRILVQISLGW